MTAAGPLPCEMEVDRLKARVRKLAEEKSNLQLVVSLIERLNPLPGLEDMVKSMLYAIVDTIGGTNIKLYYWVEGELRYLDFLGEQRVLPAIDDPAVARVQESREFLELAGECEDSLLRGAYVPGSWTWIFPLTVGAELIGIAKLENVNVIGASLRNYLPIFFSHAALILGNEIRSYSRKKAEAALAESESRLRATSQLLDSIVENIPAMIFLKRAEDLRFVLFNKAGESLLGLGRETLLGKNDYDFFPRDQAEAFIDKDREVLASDRVADIREEPIDTRNGRRYLHTRKLALRNARGEPEYLLGISDDITDFKKAQEELDRYRQHLEDLVAERTAALEAANRQLNDTQFAMDRAGIAIHWVDAESGRLLYVNDQACEMLGYTREEMLAMDVFDINPTMSRTDFSELMKPLIESRSMRIESENRTKAGSIIPVEITLYYQPGAGGATGRLFAFLTDITLRKAAELALMSARDAAETANRMKSVFLANMSHELRTPLNAILGFAQIMERDPRIPEDERHNLHTINRSGRHLLTLINDVLEISRIEAGQLSVQKQPCDLDELIEGARQFVELRARDKGLALGVERDPSLPRYVVTDGGKLRQILLNLLSNAVKYTEKGSITLRASAKPAGDHVLVEMVVSDTGVGIAPDDLRRIFDPFFQASYGVRLGEGTGLGLSIARKYAHILDGELTAQSTPGQGSVFRISLPCELAAAVVPPVPAPRHVLGLAPDQAPRRVLVVEDDADSRRFLMELLDQVGFAVSSAENGAEAVSAFASWHPELVWMDMRMPVMDGYEATRRIRALPGGKTVKIVALTASAFHEDRGAIFAAGCDAVVTKPQEADAMLALMGDLLGVRYRYDEADGEPSPLAEPDFSMLPADLRDQLREAAEILDADAVRSLVERVRPISAPLADRLEALVAEFRFDLIVARCGGPACR